MGSDPKKQEAFLESNGSVHTGETSEKAKLRWLFLEAVQIDRKYWSCTSGMRKVSVGSTGAEGDKVGPRL